MDEAGQTGGSEPGDGPARAARIQDVARLAEVSTATVSRALATPERVSPQARARVLEAIAKIGYVPNPAARTLRSQKTGMVLVVCRTCRTPSSPASCAGSRRPCSRRATA
jgi:LacI family repressor for deo operon, udp, cdd, tsx, nupC, and nupG